MVSIIPNSNFLIEETVLETVLNSIRGSLEDDTYRSFVSFANGPLEKNITSSTFLLEVVNEVDLLFQKRTELSPATLSSRILSLRMRVLATCLGLGGEFEFDQVVEIFTPSPLVSFALTNSVVVVLPETIQNAADEEQMLHDFELLFEKTGCRMKWIVDCSGFRTFSGMLFGNLIFYQDRLREAQKGLYLYWLKPDLLREKQMDTLIRILNLVKIGGQYFSSDKFE